MEPWLVGILAFLLMMVMVFVGIPVFISMLVSALVGFVVLFDGTWTTVSEPTGIL